MVHHDGPRRITRVKFNGCQKRYRPSRHYVYILQVKWSDGSDFIIYRRYSQFYQFHVTLLDMFPKESGMLKGTERTIPYLPGKIFFQRSAVKKVAMKRTVSLGDYCSELLTLSDKICACPHVVEFFETTEADIAPPPDATSKTQGSKLLAALLPFYNKRRKSTEEIEVTGPIPLEVFRAITDYSGTDRNEISLRAGSEVEVVDKNENGWWLVQSEDGKTGWAPAGFLEPADQQPEPDEPEPILMGENYLTIDSYTAQHDDELSFEKNVVVRVMHKLLDGWWIVSFNGNVGYAPATSLEPYNNPHFKASVKSHGSTFRPTPRRCSIKHLVNHQPQRDLSLYKKMSGRRRPGPSNNEGYMPMFTKHKEESDNKPGHKRSASEGDLCRGQRSTSEGDLCRAQNYNYEPIYYNNNTEDEDSEYDDVLVTRDFHRDEEKPPTKPPKKDQIPQRPPREKPCNDETPNKVSAPAKKKHGAIIPPPSAEWRKTAFTRDHSRNHGPKVPLKLPCKNKNIKNNNNQNEGYITPIKSPSTSPVSKPFNYLQSVTNPHLSKPTNDDVESNRIKAKPATSPKPLIASSKPVVASKPLTKVNGLTSRLALFNKVNIS